MDAIVEFLKAILFGIVQGITEWLPISSTGHLVLLEEFISMDKEFFKIFSVVIQLGSVLAVLILFFNKLNPFSPKKNAEQKSDTFQLWLKVIVASLPLGVIGFVFENFIEEKLRSPFIIAAALIIYGVAFIFIENRQREPKINSLKEIDYKTALCIGLFQALALIPGTSRSGSTIIGATLLGASRVVSAEFSFFMAIPAMVGASGYKLLKVFIKGNDFTGTQWLSLVIGFVTAFIVSMVVISKLMAYIKKKDFKPFGYYRIVLGIVVIAYFLVKSFL